MDLSFERSLLAAFFYGGICVATTSYRHCLAFSGQSLVNHYPSEVVTSFMSEVYGSAKKSFQNHASLALVLMMSLYVLSLAVDLSRLGQDLMMTAAVAVVMIAATCATLTAFQDGLTTLALRARR